MENKIDRFEMIKKMCQCDGNEKKLNAKEVIEFIQSEIEDDKRVFGSQFNPQMDVEHMTKEQKEIWYCGIYCYIYDRASTFSDWLGRVNVS